MTRKTKQFGITKQSKRRLKRKKHDSRVIEPAAIVPRHRASVVYQLFSQRREYTITLSPELKRLLA